MKERLTSKQKQNELLDFAANSDLDSPARKYLDHVMGSAAAGVIGLTDLIVGAFNHDSKNFLLGLGITVASDINVRIHFRLIEKIQQRETS